MEMDSNDVFVTVPVWSVDGDGESDRVTVADGPVDGLRTDANNF
jgi:hypothetical protein